MAAKIQTWLASPHLTVALLFYSVFLVFFATLAQVEIGVAPAATKFFESFFGVYKFWGVPVPFFGGAFVGVLAVVNIFFSCLRRLSFGLSGFGNSIIHCALALLVISGGLQYFMRVEGALPLRQGESSNILHVGRGSLETRKLPFSVRLVKFEKQNWQGSEIPKSFSSQVVFLRENHSREALIEMNSPASFDGWTFYQTSYADGGKVSVLTAVKNPARMLPWLAVGAVFAGMLIAFFARFRGGRK